VELLRAHIIEPGETFSIGGLDIFPFKTNHGDFALGSVGYMVTRQNSRGESIRLVYTSDFEDLPETPPSLLSPDYLIIQSFWLNEPRRNTPHHMSFQRALDFIEAWNPKKETFLVHIGDGDCFPGDRANTMLKKRQPIAPMRSPGGEPYSVPRNQKEWEAVVARILKDRKLRHRVHVAFDGMCLHL
jgi:phosphoribosyl 1,2-cyclic phosphate phosphodiesterase